MKKQAGMSALKLILCIAGGILTAGFIGSIISFLLITGTVAGIVNAIKNQPETKPTTTTSSNNQFHTPPAQQPVQNQQIISNNAKQGYIEYKGNRTYYQTNKTIPNQQIIQNMSKKKIQYIETPHPNTEELTRQDVIDYRKNTSRF